MLVKGPGPAPRSSPTGETQASRLFLPTRGQSVLGMARVASLSDSEQVKPLWARQAWNSLLRATLMAEPAVCLL